MLNEAGYNECQKRSQDVQFTALYVCSVNMESVLRVSGEESRWVFPAVGLSLKDSLKVHV